jgi:hypothetical protein
MSSVRTIVASFIAIVVASIVLANCSGSGGSASSVVAPHPSPSPSGTPVIGPNMYVANVASPGPNFEQFKPTTAPSSTPAITASSTPSITIADDPAVFTAAADAGYVAEAGDSNELGFFAQPLTGSSTPTVATVPTSEGIIKLTFDASGNLWGSNFDNDNVLEYTPPFSASSKPALTVSTGLSFPTGLAFDAAQNLYVVNGEEPTGTAPELLEFSPPYTGSPSTTVTLPLAVSGTVEAGGVAIWENVVAVGVFENEAGARPRVKAVAHVRPLALRRPSDVFAPFRQRGHIVRPQGVETGGEILFYALPLSSGSVPTVTIADPTAFDVAFDAFGNLYVANPFQDAVQVFTPPFGVSSSPTYTITNGISEPTSISFGP